MKSVSPLMSIHSQTRCAGNPAKWIVLLLFGSLVSPATFSALPGATPTTSTHSNSHSNTTPSIKPASHLQTDGEIRQQLAQAAADGLREKRAVPMQRLQEQLSRSDHQIELPRSSRRTTRSESKPRSWAQVAEQARRGTLILAGVSRAENDGSWEVNTSTAFLIAPDGIFVTCRHVFLHDNYQTMVAMTGEGRIALVREVLASNESQDVAIGRLAGGDFPFLSLRAELQAGEEVGIMSHPHGQFFTFTRGGVSRCFEAMEEGVRVPMFAVDADFGPGSSGAPVLDAKGMVIGMADSIQMRTPRVGPAASFNPPMIFKHCRPVSSWTNLVKIP